MKTVILQLELLDYWHIGTGLGLGPIADAVAVKDDLGLPYLPGKTLKGLLRDVCELAAETESNGWTERKVNSLFGRKGTDSTEGRLHFSNAEIDEDTRNWLSTESNKKELASSLFARIAQTAIDDEKGVADNKSLRVAEVTLPVVLTAEIEGPDNDDLWVKDLKQVLPMLRGLGTARRRGFGRVKCSFIEED